MRIALIFPPYGHRKFSENLKVVDEEFTLSPPIILAYVAAIMEKAGHDVILIDAHALKLSKEEVLHKIKSFRPDLLAFRVETYNFHQTLEWIEYLKLSTGLKVLVGGINMDIYPLETMSYKAIDFGLQGEVLNTLPRFLDALENGKSFENIAGLYWRENGEIKYNSPDFKTVDFNLYPFPARHLLPNEVYHSFVSKNKNFTIMLTQTGCPYRCRFCAIAAIKKYRMPAYRKRSWENVVREFEICYYDFGIREVDIFDATFFIDKERDIKICQEIRKRGIKINWTCRSRVDVVNEEVLKEASKSGCRMIFWGIESASQNVLNSIHKDIKTEQTVRAIKLSKKYGIDNLGFLMIGNSGDTKQTIYDTVDFAKKLGLDYVQICRTIAKPSTELHNELIKFSGYDWWKEYILSKKEEERLPAPWSGLSQVEIENLLKKAYYRFYFRPSYIMKRIISIKSFEELFRYIKVGIRMLAHYFYTDVSGFQNNAVKNIAHMSIDKNPERKILSKKVDNVYIILPTFNENENLIGLLRQIFALYPEFNVVVVDSEINGNNSFVDSLKFIYADNLHIIKLNKRSYINERGYAVKKGIKYALEKGAEIIVEMDADYSHRPYYISEMIEFIDKYDMVIGSRYNGGTETGRNLLRSFLSKLGNLYVKYMLGIKNVADCTSGFRCYTREALLKIGVDNIDFSEGSAVLIEMLYRAVKNNLKIKEVPIIYYERKFGRSKFSLKTVTENIKSVFVMRRKYEYIR